MNDIFWYIVHKSLIAGLLILIILLLRQFFKKVPKGPICIFWILLSFQLLVPPLFESRFALIPEEIAQDELKEGWNRGYLEPVRIIREGETDYERAIELGIEPQIEMDGVPAVIVREDSLTIPRKTTISWVTVLMIIWISGTVLILLYGLFAVLRIRFQTAQSIMVRKRVFICDEIDSPFAFGLFNPRIYLPSGIPSEYVESVYRHEMMHIKRKDLFWRFFGFILLAVYWINPLSWAAYHLLCRDIESACDEKAIRDLNPDQRALYCKALLECGLKQRKVYVSPVCFGETNVLERVKKVISYKKTKKWVTTVILMICLILGTQVVLKPAKAEPNHTLQQGLTQSDLIQSGTNILGQVPEVKPDPETSSVYLDPQLAAYAKEARKTADAKWDGVTEIPFDSDFLGEIRLIDNDGNEVHYALFRQSGEIQKKNYSYIWWVQHEGDQFSAAQDTGILWQVPGLPDFYSYYGTADLQEFFRLVLKERLDRAYDVEFNTVKELDLSAYTIQRPMNAGSSFFYPSAIRNKKLQAYAEQVRLESNTQWDGKTEVPGMCTCLGEIWLDYGNVQIQYILYAQEAVLNGQPYQYIWWAQDTLHRGQIPYTREYGEAKDADLLWQAPGLSDFYSYYGVGSVQEFQEKVLMTPIRNGYDVLYNSVSSLDLDVYMIHRPADADDWFVYTKPLYNKMLAAFAENKRMEANSKWDGKSEIPGKSVCLGEVQMKHNGDHIQYVVYDQTAMLQGKEYHYLWWAKTTREYFVDEHCIRQYFETKEDDILWQAPGLSDFYSYYGVADLEDFKHKVLMKDMQYNYDVIYNTIEDLDLSAYTYPRQEATPEYDGEYIQAYTQVVRQLEAQYGKAHEGGSNTAPYLYGLVMAKMIDFDQDGTPELLCSYTPQEGVVHYNYEIYCYEKGQAKQIYSGNGYDGCTDVNPSITLLQGNGRIYIRVSGGEWTWFYYTVGDHALQFAAQVYATAPYYFNGTSYGDNSNAYQKAFDQYFGYPMTTTYRYEIPSLLAGRQGVYVEEVFKQSPSGSDQGAGNQPSPSADKQTVIDNLVNIHADFAYPDLADYALNIRKENLMKWDFVDEVPTKLEYLGEVALKFNSARKTYILFRQEAEFKGQHYSYIWWAGKEAPEFDESINDWKWTYFEARDAGILWQAPGLSDYFSYYGAGNLQAFEEQVLAKDFQVYDIVYYNSVLGLTFPASVMHP